MRNLFALLMLIVLSLSGAAPACAQAPAPAAHPMGHHQPRPKHCDEGAAAHANCIGCGTELPDAPRVEPVALAPVALSPIARLATLADDTQLNLPLRPPRA